MSKTPVANYSPENVIILKSVYGSAKTDTERKDAVKAISAKIGKTVNSVRAKLTKMGIYVKPKTTSKSGTVVVRKSELVKQIATELKVDPGLMVSMEGSTKFVLEKVISHMLVLNRIISDLENSE